jgi:hypothetical protein
MICGRRFGSLDKFLKLTPEHIVHLQLSRDLFGDVQAVGATRVKIRFLQNDNVCICIREESYDRIQLQAAIDVPIDDAQGTGRPRHPTERREIAHNDFWYCHVYALAMPIQNALI